MRPSARHLALLAAIAILVALVALLLLRPPVAAPTDPAGGASATASADDPAQGEPPARWASVAWERLIHPFPETEIQPRRFGGIVVAGDMLLAFGQADTPGRNEFGEMGAVFVSRDGSSWRTLLLEHGVRPAEVSTPRGIAFGPRGAMAWGEVCCQPGSTAMWHSEDGERWTRLPGDGNAPVGEALGGHSSAVKFIGIETGWVVVGSRDERPAAWWSEDGSTWESAEVGDAGGGTGLIADVANDGGRLVAVGRVDSPDGSWDGAVWTSDDGRAWERIAIDDPELVNADDTNLARIVPFETGLLVVGIHALPEERQRCEGTAGECHVPFRERHWVSQDGRGWVGIDPNTAAGEHPIEFRALDAGGPGLVNLGESSAAGSPDPSLFTSADGRTWSIVRPRDRFTDVVMMGVAVRGNQIVAVADSVSGAGRSAARIWVGVVE